MTLAYVTGVVVQNDVYSEVDSVEITDYIWIEPAEKYFDDSLPSNTDLDATISSDFFCVHSKTSEKYLTEIFGSIEENQETKGTTINAFLIELNFIYSNHNISFIENNEIL